MLKWRKHRCIQLGVFDRTTDVRIAAFLLLLHQKEGGDRTRAREKEQSSTTPLPTYSLNVLTIWEANKNRELNHEIYITLLTVVWTPSNRYDKPWAAKYFDYFVRAETQSHYITIKKLNNTTTPCREINTKMSSENRYVENELIGGMHTFANSLQQQHNLPAPGGYEWWSAFPHQQTGSSETIFHELQSRSVFRLTSLSNKLNEFELNALKLLQL